MTCYAILHTRDYLGRKTEECLGEWPTKPDAMRGVARTYYQLQDRMRSGPYALADFEIEWFEP